MRLEVPREPECRIQALARLGLAVDDDEEVRVTHGQPLAILSRSPDATTTAATVH
ncbi:MAG: hypothetical protein R3C97_14900 [Geminicoccaceae bacterium]